MKSNIQIIDLQLWLWVGTVETYGLHTVSMSWINDLSYNEKPSGIKEGIQRLKLLHRALATVLSYILHFLSLNQTFHLYFRK